MNEVSQLAIRAKGDASLVEALWLSVERFIRVWVNRYHPRTGTRLYDADDLTQAGFLAVCDAVRDYDETQGMEFVGFLCFSIRRRFREVMGTRGTKVRPEVGAVSLDVPLDEADGATRLDMLADTGDALDATVERLAASQDVSALLPVIDALPDEQRRALLLTVWDGLTVIQAAQMMNATPERVQGYKGNALRTVRNSMAARRIRKERAPFRHVTLAEFRHTGTSSVEWAVGLGG